MLEHGSQGDAVSVSGEEAQHDDAPGHDMKLGYKRPPLQTRFRPGVSGNPLGRQKGVRNFAADVKRTLEIPVTLSENGKSKRVSTEEA